MFSRLVPLVALALAACGSSSKVLIRLDPEMAGEHCTHGGIKVLTGADANLNSKLEDGEVDASQTQYVCNGANGTQGQPGMQGDAGVGGHNALSVLTPEPAGSNCQYGGTKVEAGLDLDDDGQLAAAEVSSTRYICERASIDAIYFGDVRIRSDDDLRLLDGIQVLAGHLTIEGAPAGVLTLPTLRVVSGEIHLLTESPELRAYVPVRELHFPALRRAQRVRIPYADSLTTLDFPVLQRVEEFDLAFSQSVATLALPALEIAADSFAADDNTALTTLRLPALRSVGSFNTAGNALLATLEAPALRTVDGYLNVSENAVLPDCAAWSLLVHLTQDPRFGHALSGNGGMVACTAAQVCRAPTVPGLTGFSECLRPSTFAAAQATCQTVGTGAGLAWVTSSAEWTALSAAVDGGALTGGWIGYSDTATEGTYVAVSGFTGYSPTSETSFWAMGQPSDTQHTENAVLLTSSGTAADADEAGLQPFLCRQP